MQVCPRQFQSDMTEVDKLLKVILTVDDGLKLIAQLETKSADFKKKGQKSDSHKSALILEEFRDKFYKAEVVKLTLAIEPGKELLSGLTAWFSGNLGSRVIIDLKIDPQIIGGIKVICRNHFRDFSLAGIIEETTKIEFNQIEGQKNEPVVMPSAII